MPLLAIDGSTARPVVSLRFEDGTWTGAVGDPETRHGRAFIPLIRDVLEMSQVAPRDLAAIAVGVGPGSFTGLRVAIAAAKSMTFALRCPLVALESDRLLAASAPLRSGEIAVLVEAQRNELAVSRFIQEQGALVRLSDPTIGPTADWLDRLPPDTYLLGPALERLRPRLDPSREAGSSWPEPEPLARVAREAHARGRFAKPETLIPNYLRRPAAEEKLENR
jgi:tRNA threonylcarbamoyladenosine biosynthesis protein TsaB